MGAKYTNQTVSGYNTSPPSDDGSQVASNQVKWSLVKTKLSDPLNTFATNINSALLTALDTTGTTTAVTYTTQASDHLKPIQITAAATVHLGTAATMGAGYQVTVVNLYSASITVDLATGTDTLNTIANGSILLNPGWAATFAINQAANGYNIISHSSYDNLGPYSIQPAFVKGETSNLKITNNAGTPYTKLDVSADEIVVKDTNNSARLISNLSVTINTAGTGAAGIDTGTQAASTWYFVWAISKNDGTASAIVSTSSSAPTMPAGYTFKARIGAWYSDGSTHFVGGWQFNNRFFYQAEQTALSGGSSTSEATVSLTAFVPTTAKIAILSTHSKIDGNGSAAIGSMLVRISTGVNYDHVNIGGGTQTTSFYNDKIIEIPLINQSYIYVWSITTGSSQASTHNVTGFIL